MAKSRLRKVGGSVMLSVPAPILRMLELEAGQAVELAVEGGRLVAEPQRAPSYTLGELLADWEPPDSNPDGEWLASQPAGRELL